MKPCDIEFYEELIERRQKVRIHLKGGKENPEGVVLKESERVIIMQVTDELDQVTKKRLIYKAAISMVEEL